MNRRQFLFTSFASGTGLLVPHLVNAAVKQPGRLPLIIHTVVLRPHPDNWDDGSGLSVEKSNGQDYLTHKGSVFGIGTD